LKVNLTGGSDCIDLAAQQALCTRIFQITGGTGRFQGATGAVTLTMTLVPVLADASNNPVFFAVTGDFTGTVSGTVTPPASGTTSAVANPKGLATSNSQTQLDGTASTSADGKPLSYSWTQPANSPVATIGGATTATPLVQFTGGPGNYTFTLTVTDDTGKTATDIASATFQARSR
jgi:hypothetical protein